MKLLPIVGLLLSSFFSGSLIAQSLSEISTFAAEICNEVAQSGDITKTKIEGNIEGKLSGVARLLGGSISSDGSVLIDETKYSGVPYEKLSGHLTSALECRRELAKILIEERRRVDESRASAPTNNVDACVASKAREYEAVKKTQINGGASASGPGLKGGTNNGHQDVCHRVGGDQKIISALTENTCCHGGRCSVTAPIISEESHKVCVTAHAWSESKSFGGGGCAKYNLIVSYKDVATETVLAGFKAECS